ncbi:hypothetical protein L9F63_003620, partial [Diploptera punctata]
PISQPPGSRYFSRSRYFSNSSLGSRGKFVGEKFVLPSGVGENLFFPREWGKICSSLGSRGKLGGTIPIFFKFFPRESGKIWWDVFSSSPTGGYRYFFNRGENLWDVSPLLPLEDPDIFHVLPSGFIPRESGENLFFPRESGKISDPDIFQVLPSGVGKNFVGRSRYFPVLPSGVGENLFFPRESGKISVGRFLLFSHWRTSIFLKFFPRESRKIWWDVFSSSPTGGSRYFSSSSLGSRGKFVLPSGVGENLVELGENLDPDIFQVLPSGIGVNLVRRFLLFSHWRIPIYFKFFHRESGKI